VTGQGSQNDYRNAASVLPWQNAMGLSNLFSGMISGASE